MRTNNVVRLTSTLATTITRLELTRARLVVAAERGRQARAMTCLRGFNAAARPYLEAGQPLPPWVQDLCDGAIALLNGEVASALPITGGAIGDVTVLETRDEQSARLAELSDLCDRFVGGLRRARP